MKWIRVEKKKDVTLNFKLINFIMPNIVYIPFFETDQLKIKFADKVKKGQILFERTDNFTMSPVSGKVCGFMPIDILKRKNQPAVAIDNDLQERVLNTQTTLKKITQYTSLEVLEILEKYKIRDLTGASTLLNLNDLNEKKLLIIKAFADDPYTYTYEKVLDVYLNELLECLNALKIIFKIPKVVIIVKKRYELINKKVLSKIGMYPELNLKIWPDYYGLEQEMFLKTKYPQAFILDLNNVLVLYNILKKKKITTKKIISVTSLEEKKIKLVNVKLNTKMIEVINKCFKDVKIADVIVNGVIKGQKVDPTNMIIDENIESITLLKIKSKHEDNCINCGACSKVCPYNFDPKYKMYNREICQNCQLCNYVCPAKINLIGEEK